MKIIKQKTDNDCVLCCVAIIAELTYKQARNLFPLIKDPPYSSYEMKLALTKIGFYCDYSDPNHTYSNSLMTMAVPSLNFPAIHHQIVADTRTKQYKIYDPNKGVEGRKFYKEWEDIKGFADVIRLINVNII